LVHKNTIELIRIDDEIINLGWYEKHPRKNFCEYVAEQMNEMGNEFPSDKAIKYARKILTVYANRRQMEKKRRRP
jgi:hypothetical protein